MKKITSAPLYAEMSLIEVEKRVSQKSSKIVLDGQSLDIPDIISGSSLKTKVSFTQDPRILKRIQKCYEAMMADVKNGVPIYGCNTGYGAQASHVVNNGTEEMRLKMARKISEGIAHIDVTVGPECDSALVRAAMLIRINMLMNGVSAVKLADLEIYRKMLNSGITPVVNMYGGIGASGDLAHNCRVLNAARQMKGVKVRLPNGKKVSARRALRLANIPALHLDPKAGLGFVNGDNFSTALAAQLAHATVEALILIHVVGAMTLEVVRGTNRSFHPLLETVRPHDGQRDVAEMMRFLLDGSQLAYQEMTEHLVRPKGVKVQDGYSLRGMSQYLGVDVAKIKTILDTIRINANSVSDNPLWVNPELVTEGEKPWHWVSGANFIAMHMVDCMDDMRKIMTHIVKLCDRHLARMVNANENNGLPSNLSDRKAVTQCAFKGVQIQSGMFDVYSSLLSMPVSTFFGVHEESNQDITSHALTSGILGLDNIRLVRYALAQNMIAACQAVDIRGGRKLLSKHTRPLYDYVRSKVDFVKKERPLNNDIEKVYADIESGVVNSIVRSKIFSHESRS